MIPGGSQRNGALAAGPVPGFLLCGWAAGALEAFASRPTANRVAIILSSAALASATYLVAALVWWVVASLGRRLPGAAKVRGWLDRFTAADAEGDRSAVILAHGFVITTVVLAVASTVVASLVLPPLFDLQVERVGIGLAGGVWVVSVALSPLAAFGGAALLRRPLTALDARYRLPIPRRRWAQILLLVALPATAAFYPFLRRYGAMIGPVRDAMLALLVVVTGIPCAMAFCGASERLRRIAAPAIVVIAIASLGANGVLHGTRGQRPLAAEDTLLVSLGARLARELTDVDRDGTSSLFGGNDCAPFDPRRSPGMTELFGNGIDEDCDGRDAPSHAAKADAAGRFSGALPAPQIKKYNFIWVIMDAVRADHVGAFGYQRPTTPFLDELAAESLVFERAFTQASGTIISIPSQLCGRDPAAIKWARGKNHFQMIPDETLLAERLASAGYKTGAVVSGYINAAIPQCLQGVQKIYEAEPDKVRKNNRPRRNPIATARAAEFLATIGAHDRFFLVVYYPDAHAPYTRHTDVDTSRFENDELGDYDAEIRWTDQQLRALVNVVRARDSMYGETVIVVTADHGEEFGEHGGEQHGITCHREVTHVPLVVRIPGLAGRRVQPTVGLVDVVPTILELTGLTDDTDLLSGQSLLVPALAPAKLSPNRQLFCAAASTTDAYGTYFRRSMRQGRYALFHDVNEGRFSFFDTDEDPGESRDLIDDPAYTAHVQQMKAELSASLTGNLRDHTKW